MNATEGYSMELLWVLQIVFSIIVVFFNLKKPMLTHNMHTYA